MTYVRHRRITFNKKIGYPAAAVVLLLAALSVYLIFFNTEAKEVSKISALGAKDHMTVLRAAQTIRVGDAAETAKLEAVSIPLDLVPEGAVTSEVELSSKRVINEVSVKEILTTKDLGNATLEFEEGDRLMEHTFQEGAIPMAVDTGSLVDIKLFRAGRADAVVVSKVIVIHKLGSTMSFYLNAVEQENLKEANAEGTLFLVRYLSNAQQASEMTYTTDFIRNSVTSKASKAEDFAGANDNGGE